MKNTLRKVFAVLLVPVIAVLASEISGIVQRGLATLLAGPELHSDIYEVPHRLSYFISSLVIGFLPAVLLRKFMGLTIAALAPPLLIAVHEVLALNPFLYFHAPSMTSDLFYYLLSWSIANYVGLIIWGTPRKEMVV